MDQMAPVEIRETANTTRASTRTPFGPLSVFAIHGSAYTVILLTTILVILRITPHFLHNPVILIGSGFLIIYLATRYWQLTPSPGLAAAFVAVFLAVCVGWTVVTSPFFDYAYDTYLYHLAAVRSVADGWHPFFSPHENIWVDSYPNGHWSLQSVLFRLTGDVYGGRSLTAGLAFILFFLSFGFFSEILRHVFPKTHHVIAFFFAGLVAASPIVVLQSLTHYTDAALYLYGSLFCLFLLAFVFLHDRLSLAAACAAIILMVNTKTSALYYAPLIGVGGLLSAMALNGRDALLHFSFRWVLSPGLVLASVTIVGVAVIGFRPHVTNILDHGSILYPLPDDILRGQAASNIEPLPGPAQFFYGLLAETKSGRPFSDPAVLKIPGTFRFHELTSLKEGTRRGGFGPFFSLAVFAALAAFAIGALADRGSPGTKRRAFGLSLALSGAMLLAASIFFPEPWWARYIPFVWLSTVLTALASLFLLPSTRPLRFVVLGLVAIGVGALSANILAAAASTAKSVLYMERDMNENFADMSEYEHIVVGYLKRGTRGDSQSPTAGSGDQSWARVLTFNGVAARVRTPLGDCEPSIKLNGAVHWCGFGSKDE